MPSEELVITPAKKIMSEIQTMCSFKIALEVCSVGAIIPTNFVVPKISFVPYKVKYILAKNQ